MGPIRTGMVAAVALLAVWPARAAQWDITPSAAVEEEYTDNLGLRTDSQDRNSDFITTVSPGISVRGTGGRVSLNGDYTYSRLFHMQQPEVDSDRHSLNAQGTGEIWDKSVFIDAGAQILNQVANPQAAVSASSSNLDVNTLETTSWNIGPRFLHHFGTWVETTSILRYTAMSTNEPNNGSDASSNNFGASSGTLTGARTIGDSAINEASFFARSGRTFTQVLWTLTAHDITTSSEGAPHHNDKLGRADVTYVVNRQLSLNVGGGKQIINDDALTISRSGWLWSIGATYRPGPRVTLDVAYNHQYDTEFFTYSGVYNVSPRTSLSLSHTQSVETTQEALRRRAPQFDPASGAFIDPVTGLPINPFLSPTGLQNDTLFQKAWNLTGSSRSGRNSYSLNLNRTETEVERTGQVTTQMGVLASYSRSMTHRLTGSLSASYRMTETENGIGSVAVPIPGISQTTANGESTQILLSGSLGYTLTPETSLSFRLNYSAFDGGAESLNTHEKSATIGLRRTF